MTKKTWPIKDTDEVLDYQILWADRLGTGGDTIDTSVWEVPDGITKDSDSNTGTTTTIWLSGGETGQTYALLNRITTDQLRTMDQTVYIKIKDK